MRLRFTVLGKGSPNMTQDGRKTMCAAGLSDDLGMVRVYPFNVETNARIWDVVECDVDRSDDNRKESWKLVGSHSHFKSQGELISVVGRIESRQDKREILEACVLKSGSEDPVNYLNDRRMSLAVVVPDRISANLDINVSTSRKVTNSDRYQDWVWTQDQYEYCPRIVWNSLQGSRHEQKIVAHEFFVGLQKFPENPLAVFQNARVYDRDYRKWLLIGNMKDMRTSWIVVHLHRLSERDLSFTLPSCGLLSGKPSAWPYCAQEGENAKRADAQLALFSCTT